MLTWLSLLTCSWGMAGASSSWGCRPSGRMYPDGSTLMATAWASSSAPSTWWASSDSVELNISRAVGITLSSASEGLAAGDVLTSNRV